MVCRCQRRQWRPEEAFWRVYGDELVLHYPSDSLVVQVWEELCFHYGQITGRPVPYYYDVVRMRWLTDSVVEADDLSYKTTRIWRRVVVAP